MGKGKHKEKAERPSGSIWRIYARMMRQYACRYWFRLLLGIVAGLVMGGAMRAYLGCMDIGVASLEGGFGKQQVQTEDGKKGLADSIGKNRFIKWALEAVHIDLEKTPKPEGDGASAGEGDQGTPENKSLGKISSVSRKLGFEISTDEAISFELVCVIIVVMLMFFGLKALGEFTNKYFLRWVGAKVVTDIRADLFHNFQRQSLAFYAKHDVGQIISRCTYDAGAVEHAFSNCIAELFIAPVQILVAFSFLVEKAYASNLQKPTFILIVALPVFLVPVYAISLLLRRYQHAVLGRISLLVARMQENLSGIRVVKSYNTEDFENSRFNRENTKYFKAVAKSILADIFMSPVMHVTAIALGAGFILLCFHYNISLGTLAVLGYAAQNAYKPIKELARMNTNLQKCAAAAERIFEALDYNEVLPEAEKPVAMPKFKDKIEFRNVTFAYENEQEPVLRNFNLTIRRGEMVAVVGPTGSGKSTLANLLARFYDPQQGQILIDGVELRSISNKDLRNLIGIVAQDNFLFNESVGYNIAYGTENASQEQIENAARLANAHGFIMEENAGYARPAGERGCLLSGGQKQRIAIARAILKNPPILILDEATSALDTVTEQQVQQAINELMKERTVLAIAHRLSTIVNADKIILVDGGGIVEQGTHQELYALNGRYRQLYEMQIKPKK